MLSLTEQLFSFLVGIGIGLVLGFLYDIYRFLRGTFRIRRLGVYLGDFLYWLIATVVTFCVLLFLNNGEVRFYIFIAIALGGIIYFSLLSLPCLQFMTVCLRGMNRFYRTAGKFYTAVKGTGVKIWRVVAAPFCCCRRKIRKRRKRPQASQGEGGKFCRRWRRRFFFRRRK